MLLFAGSSHPALAHALSAALGVPLGDVTIKRFSCGECYVKYGQSVRGKPVYILQAPGRDPDQHLMELLFLCQAAKLSFASSVHVIIPQFPYARQDRVSQPRESISAKLVAQLVEDAGADHIITLALHSDQMQGFFSIPVDVLDTRSLFADHFRSRGLKDPVIVSPDVGGAKQAKRFADLLGADLAILHKTRSAHHDAKILEVVGDVAGRRCIIFDDMIDTAGTIVSAVDALRSRGAHPDIAVAATHPVFSGPALERLRAIAPKEVVVTDSIPCDPFPGLTVLPIAPLLAEVISHVESGQSVTEIYKKTTFRKKGK
ncbi:MAG: Uncharacterized protein G01um101425_663 [Candidatus Peregrinibacteria bacterium Gr01-1014_25]|nr:MAG: Uncharacterized protein G01um101425_663 [Candidatus Peregrinibacteria bacterium Gr01-1014_25]